MKLSVKSDYAARAILDLARHAGGRGSRRIEEIARDQGIPPNYLVQILIDLKSAKIVRSQRGKEGGYRLARPPGEITLGDVLRCFHGEVFDTPALEEGNRCEELRRAWSSLRETLEAKANSINFQQLADQTAEREKMYYI